MTDDLQYLAITSFFMKKIFFIAFACLIPSANAVDYVKCEAIRSVISRNSIQRQEAFKNSYDNFEMKKRKEKFGERFCSSFDYGSKKYNECNKFTKTIWEEFKDEGSAFRQSAKEPYNKIEIRATKDFDKNGCYWF